MWATGIHAYFHVFPGSKVLYYSGWGFVVLQTIPRHLLRCLSQITWPFPGHSLIRRTKSVAVSFATRSMLFCFGWAFLFQSTWVSDCFVQAFWLGVGEKRWMPMFVMVRSDRTSLNLNSLGSLPVRTTFACHVWVSKWKEITAVGFAGIPWSALLPLSTKCYSIKYHHIVFDFFLVSMIDIYIYIYPDGFT